MQWLAFIAVVVLSVAPKGYASAKRHDCREAWRLFRLEQLDSNPGLPQQSFLDPLEPRIVRPLYRSSMAHGTWRKWKDEITGSIRPMTPTDIKSYPKRFRPPLRRLQAELKRFGGELYFALDGRRPSFQVDVLGRPQIQLGGEGLAAVHENTHFKEWVEERASQLATHNRPGFFQSVKSGVEAHVRSGGVIGTFFSETSAVRAEVASHLMDAHQFPEFVGNASFMKDLATVLYPLVRTGRTLELLDYLATLPKYQLTDKERVRLRNKFSGTRILLADEILRRTQALRGRYVELARSQLWNRDRAVALEMAQLTDKPALDLLISRGEVREMLVLDLGGSLPRWRELLKHREARAQ